MASTYLDLPAMNAALKEYYDGQTVENLVYKDNPFFAMVKKMTEFGGKVYPVPILTGVSQGRSSSFTNAQGNQSPVQLQEFMLTRKTDYSIATIDNQTMEASRTDKMSFLRGAQVMIDGAIRTITLSIASSLFRSGTGSIGQISTIGSVGTGVVALVNADDIVQFEVNMVLQCTNGTTDGNTPRAALGYVIAVNRNLGQLTLSAVGLGGAAGSPAAWTTNEYLLVQGDSNAKPSGLAAWLPTTDPATNDSFYQVNRSVDRTRLAGVYYDGSTQSMEEAFIDGSQRLGREGGKPDVCIISFAGFSALEKSLGAKVQYIDWKGPADIAFRGIRLHGHNTEMRVFPDRNCPSGLGYMLQMDTWELLSLNDAPHIVKYADGLEMLRVSNADAAEVRIAAYYNLACKAPGWNAVLKLAA